VADDTVVLDASALVDLLVGQALGQAVGERIEGSTLHAPAHLDAEVLSALGRLHRGGVLSARRVSESLEAVAEAPIERHPLPGLIEGAWRRRQRLRLVDALYVELAEQLGVRVVSTDAALGRAAPAVHVVTG
jgi:predicted nucleic acid-binding protein